MGRGKAVFGKAKEEVGDLRRNKGGKGDGPEGFGLRPGEDDAGAKKE